MVAIEVLGAILQFAVDRLVQIFHDGHSGSFSSLEMRLDVFDEDSEALRPEAQADFGIAPSCFALFSMIHALPMLICAPLSGSPYR